MSQSALTTPEREGDWDRWYVEHLRIMATVPGVSSTQRFKTETPDQPRSLAMYSIASAEVFNDPYYQSVRGMGEWLALIDRRYYRRNLFDGLERAPEVGAGEVLLVADRDEPDRGLADIEWNWLECVGIDRSTRFRGIAVLEKSAAQRSAAGRVVALYFPFTSLSGRTESRRNA